MASLELDKAPVLVDAASAALELTRIDSIGAASVMTEMSRLAVFVTFSENLSAFLDTRLRSISTPLMTSRSQRMHLLPNSKSSVLILCKQLVHGIYLIKSV